MIHSCAMRVLCACLLICLGAGDAWAKKTKAPNDSDPERSLARARQAQTAV